VDSAHVQKTLDSIYRNNHKPNLYGHDCVQRTFALNDEAAMVICEYVQIERPKIPFPYYAEVMTGFEYSTAALMLYQGMIERGIECISDIRRRYDGQRRNPWDEAECGHHYARAMASWSAILALSGFRYEGIKRRVVAQPRVNVVDFRSFWSAGTGWGTFSISDRRFSIEVAEGSLPLREIETSPALASSARVTLGGRVLAGTAERHGKASRILLRDEVNLHPGVQLTISD
jgi:hypothetical protein